MTTSASDTELLRERIAKIRWWHRMELAPGLWTPGMKGEATQNLLELIRMPASFEGKTVLDIGSWDGFYAFEAERRGARRVLATDQFQWSGQSWTDKAGFLLAREALGSKVEDLDIDPTEITPERVGRWDVVLFLGVLYHLRNPIDVLERVASVCNELLIVETHVDLRLGDDLPAAVCYPGRELHDDPTNWWGPNPRCVDGLLHAVGFRDVELFLKSGRDGWRYDPATGEAPPHARKLLRRKRAERRLAAHARR